jgi:PIN domain nuclease of toxin-antitoxin system
MKVVLDAYAVIAALVGERAQREVAPLMREGILCAPNASEVVDVCIRVHGNDERSVVERVEWLTGGGLEIVALDSALALYAGCLRARFYRRRQCEISHGDCFAIALARNRRAPIATADPALAVVARGEGVEVISLPGSDGKRP